MEQLATQLARNHGVLLTHPTLSFPFIHSHQHPSFPSQKCFCVVTSQSTALVQNLIPILLQQPHCPSLCSSIPFALSTLLLIIVLTLRSHFNYLLIFLYWLPKVFRIKSKLLNLTYKTLHNLVLSFFPSSPLYDGKNKFLTLPLTYLFNLLFLSNWSSEIPTRFLLSTS